MSSSARSSGVRLRRFRLDLAAALLLSAVALLALVAEPFAQEAAPAAPGETDYAAMVDAVLAADVRPAHADFRIAADDLADRVGAFCAAPDETGLGAARAAFRTAAVGVFALMPLRFGPILEENRQERLAFWPDPRGIGLRQVQALLAERDPAATDPAALAGKSVAVQGLTALEFLLFGTGADDLLAGGEAGAFRCRYGAAITRNVALIAREMNEAWGPDGAATALYTDPGMANPLFQTHKEAAGEIFGAVATGLEVVADGMLAAPFGAAAAKARPRLAPFWRSGQSMAAVAAALTASEDLIAASGAYGRLGADARWLANAIPFELRRIVSEAQAISAPLEAAVADPAARERVRYMIVAVKSARGAIGRDLTAALGLEQGFNANDGD